ncbi:methyltransferase family protein [Spirosoma oryzae]|uniref:Methyltransferase family protein n=2 Tax=Spirosoma oryzae TaxID=1469603 RepID=A0A2T0S1V7_9BACT|nr:methyltransferase family protein [Spirosoma oryzae]
MLCKICSAESKFYLLTKVLGKYDVKYYKCSSCQHIQTEEPYWLDESYSNAITKLDIGLITRNELMTPVVKAVISKWYDPNALFIDYGGGYGMLVRMMRDRGFNFYRQDIYCDNLYAENFDITDVSPFKAELLTAFEVFEHLKNPVEEIQKMLALSDNILFTTSVQPNSNVTPESWWYFIPETGQHVALYSRDSLQYLADKFNLNYYWNEHNVHLFTNKKINSKLFRLITSPRFVRWYNKFISKREALLDKDFILIRNKLNANIVVKSI